MNKLKMNSRMISKKSLNFLEKVLKKKKSRVKSMVQSQNSF